MTLKEFVAKLRESDSLYEHPMKKSDGVWFRSSVEYADIAKVSAFNGETVEIRGLGQYRASFDYPNNGYKAQLKPFPATTAKKASFSVSDLS